MNTLVSFHIAKLAKEKGFNLPVNNFFYADGMSDNGDGDCEYIVLNHNLYDGYYSRPTINELQCWLTQEHKSIPDLETGLYNYI